MTDYGPADTATIEHWAKRFPSSHQHMISQAQKDKEQKRVGNIEERRRFACMRRRPGRELEVLYGRQKWLQELATKRVQRVVDRARERAGLPVKRQYDIGLSGRIIKATSSLHGVSIDALKGRSRMRHITECRQATMWLLSRHCPWLSSVAIGKKFGGRDHATVLHAITKIDRVSGQPMTQKLYTYSEFAERIETELGLRAGE